MRLVTRGAGWLAALALVAAACSRGESGGNAGDTTAGNNNQRACPGDNAGLQLPDGFCATVFADSVGDARHIVVASNGDVYATLEGTRPSPEKAVAGDRQPAPRGVVALRDTTRDGKADVKEFFGERGNTGIGIANGYLYVDHGATISRHRMTEGELVPAGAGETIVSGMPLEPGHRARNFFITQNGDLLVNVGSATNSCQVKDRGNQSPGHDPCTELNTRAGIWRFDANKTNQRFTPQARWAAGIRNGMGIAAGPNGQIFATQHGRDQFLQNWSNLFPDTAYSAENPGEELLQVSQGDNFGWPYCYYSMAEKKLVTAPEYGGDGRKDDRCTDKKGPVAVFPGHWAPMSLMFYTGNAFPEKYRNGAFIAFHGSWNRAPAPQQGYRVVFQPLNGDKSSGDFETFADGFAAQPPQFVQPGNAAHRPVGLAQGPDGALYISDDAGGRIYRVTYQGRR